MKIFLINLDRDVERRAFMEEELVRADLSVERISAVDGRALSEAELAEVYDDEAARKIGGVPLTRGHIGCSLSHIRLCQKMVADDIDRALVLEDDVRLLPQLAHMLRADWMQEDWWDYVHLSYTPMSVSWMNNWFRASAKRIMANPLFVLYVLLKLPYMLFLCLFEIVRNSSCATSTPRPVRFFRPLYHTGAYLITKRGAEKMLTIALPVRYSADQLVNRARIEAGLRFYGACPPPVRKSDAFESNTA